MVLMAKMGSTLDCLQMKSIAECVTEQSEQSVN